MLNEFPCRVETPDGTWVNYRVRVEKATPGPYTATLYARDLQIRGTLGRVSRVVHLGNRQWLVVGEDASWRMTRLTGCGCHSSTEATAPEVVAWLNEVTEAEAWEEVSA